MIFSCFSYKSSKSETRICFNRPSDEYFRNSAGVWSPFRKNFLRGRFRSLIQNQANSTSIRMLDHQDNRPFEIPVTHKRACDKKFSCRVQMSDSSK